MRPRADAAHIREDDVIDTDMPDLVSTPDRTIIDLRGDGPFVAVGHLRYLTAHSPLPPQRHRALCVFALAARSAFHFVVGGDAIAIRPGEALLIPPGTTYSTGLEAQTRGELLWLVLRVDQRRPRQGGSSLPDLIGRLARQGVTRGRAPQTAVDLLRRVVHESVDWPGRGEWREAMCAAALAELAREFSYGPTAHQSQHPSVRRALAWAEAHAHEPITAADLVRASGMSSTRFYEAFVESLGTSPKDHILRLKIERGANLLRDTDASVTDVAHALGFSSSQHFATAFRRYTGMSPTQYRSSRPA